MNLALSSDAMQNEEQGHATIDETKRATEYLANERTFLAWIRTSVAVVSLGFETRSLPALTHVFPDISTLRFSHLCRQRPRGSIHSLLPSQLYLLSRKSHFLDCVPEGRGQNRSQQDRGLVILVTVAMAVLSGAMIAFALMTAGQP